MGKSSREKGKRGEREAAALLRGLGYPEAHRTAQNCGQSGDAADVIGVDGLHLEIKRCEQIRVDEWQDQVERDSKGTGRIPVIMFRKSRRPFWVLTPAEDFFRMYREVTRNDH